MKQLMQNNVKSQGHLAFDKDFSNFAGFVSE